MHERTPEGMGRPWDALGLSRGRGAVVSGWGVWKDVPHFWNSGYIHARAGRQRTSYNRRVTGGACARGPRSPGSRCAVVGAFGQFPAPPAYSHNRIDYNQAAIEPDPGLWA